MTLFKRSAFTLIILLLGSLSFSAQAQQLVQTENDYLEIPGLKAIYGTPFHFYAHSATDGLVLFRSYKDSLNYQFKLDSFTDTTQHFQADFRFGYLYGDSTITVVDPTSILGVYSRTSVSGTVTSVQRLQEYVFILNDRGQVFQTDIRSTASFDTSLAESALIPPEVKIEAMSGYRNIIYLISTDQNLHRIELDDSGNPYLSDPQPLRDLIQDPITDIQSISRNLFGWSSSGEIWLLTGSEPTLFGTVDDAIDYLIQHEDDLYAKANSGDIYWVGKTSQKVRSTPEANLELLSNDGRLWLKSFNNVYEVYLDTARAMEPVSSVTQPDSSSVSSNKETLQTESISASTSWSLNKVGLKSVTYPRPLIVHFTTTPSKAALDLSFQAESNLSGITFHDNNLYWKPSASNVGRHPIKIIAADKYGRADTTVFVADVQAFNMPPKFSPVRPITIPVNEPFELNIQAIDPDGQDKELIRYVGLDMPQGASIDEQTGLFTWTPSARQVNTYQFRVIATDQYGTAASTDIKITVKNVQRGN